MTTIEVCVESPEGVRAARDGGADRVELCRDLRCGGLTPTFQAIEGALGLAPEQGLRILVRANPDTFQLSAAEVNRQAEDIGAILDEFGDAPVPLGFVVGGLVGRQIDVGGSRIWRQAAQDRVLVFHRGFDEIDEPGGALRKLAELGFNAVLAAGSTSGAANVDRLRELTVVAAQLSAEGRSFNVIGSGGLRAGNIGRVCAEARLTEVHFRAPFPSGEGTDPKLVAQIVSAMRVVE